MNMRDELKAFVDNELNEEQRTEILRRLETDSALQAEVIELRQMSRLIREEAWQPEPVGLEKTLSALAGPPVKKRNPWWYRGQIGWALGAASVAALAICVFPSVFSGPTSFFARGESDAAATVTMEKAEAPVVGANTMRAPVAGDVNVNAKSSHEAQGVVVTEKPPKITFGSVSGGAAATSPLGAGKAPAGPALKYQQNIYLNNPLPANMADLQVEVDDLDKAKSRARSIVLQAKGRLSEDKKLSRNQMQMQVPASRVGPVVDQLNGLGRPLNQNQTLSASASVNGQMAYRNKSPKDDTAKNERKTPDPESTLNLTFVEKEAAFKDAKGQEDQAGRVGFAHVEPRKADVTAPRFETAEPVKPVEPAKPFDPIYILLIVPVLFVGWLIARALRRS